MALARPAFAQEYIKMREKQRVPDQITIVPGLIGGAKDLTYTGKGADGKVQTDNPVMMDKTSFHEGEVVVPKVDVDGMGGPSQAMQKIRQLQMKDAERMAPTVTGMMRGGAVKRYEGGGAVFSQDDYNFLQSKGFYGEDLAGGNTYAGNADVLGKAGITDAMLPSYRSTTSQTSTGGTAAPTVATGGMIPGTEGGDLAAPATSDVPVLGNADAASPTGIRTDNDAPPTVMSNADNAAPGGIRTDNTPAITPGTEGGDLAAPSTTDMPAPIAPAPKDGDTKMVTYNGVQNKLTYKNGQWLSDKQLGLQATGSASTAPGVTVGQQAGSAANNIAAAPSPATGGVAPATFNRYTQQALQRMNAIASGDSDIFRRQANAAFLQLDARLQSNLLATAMQIANNPNLSDGAKTTMMAEQMRNAGIAQSQLAGSLATQSMQMAMEAIGKTYDMASGERAYNQDLLRQSISDAEAAQDWSTFATQYEKTYGVKLDVTNMKSAADATTITDATSWIMDQYVSGLPVTLATTGVRGQLERLWNIDHPGQPMDDVWANDWLTEHAKTMDDRWQFMRGIQNDDALMWFPSQAELDKFTYKGHAPGLESFKNAFYDFQAGGAFTVDPQTGAFDFNENSPFYALMMKTFGMTPTTTTTTTGTTTGTTTAGSTATTTQPNGTVIRTTVTGTTPQEGDTRTVAYNGQEQIMTYKGGRWLSATQVAAQSAGAGTTEAPGGQAGQGKESIPQTGLFTGADGSVYVDGAKATNPDSGSYVTKDANSPTGYVDGKGNAVTVDNDGLISTTYTRDDYESTPGSDYANWKKYAIDVPGNTLNMDDKTALEYFMRNGNNEAVKDYVALMEAGSDLMANAAVFKGLEPAIVNRIASTMPDISEALDGAIVDTAEMLPAQADGTVEPYVRKLDTSKLFGSTINYSGKPFLVNSVSTNLSANPASPMLIIKASNMTDNTQTQIRYPLIKYTDGRYYFVQTNPTTGVKKFVFVS